MTCLAPSKQTFTDDDLDGVPSPPDFRLWLEEELPKLQRPVNLSCPCIGIGNAGRAFQQLGVKYNLVNSCDVLSHLTQPLEQLEGLEGSRKGVSIGPKKGNIKNIAVGSLDIPTDMLIAGPPCPPWASNGNRNPEGGDQT